MKRNAGIELYRVLLMFGIVLLHAMTTCGYKVPGLFGRTSYFLYSCVVGFVFITGWYGVKFSLFKLAKLWGIAVWCIVVVAIVDFMMNGYSGWWHYYDILKGNWFLNAYTVLMLVAPTLNFLIDGICEAPEHTRNQCRSAVILLLFLVFGWSFLRESPLVSRLVPVSAGVESYSACSLIGIYLAAKLVRAFNVDVRLTVRMRLMIACACCVAISCHLSTYSSPFSFGLAMLGFLVFKDIKIGIRMSRLILCMSPSMFAVFLLHANPIVFGFMKSFIDRTGGAFIMTALVVFFTTLALDVPRRLLLWIILYCKARHFICSSAR